MANVSSKTLLLAVYLCIGLMGPAGLPIAQANPDTPPPGCSFSSSLFIGSNYGSISTPYEKAWFSREISDVNTISLVLTDLTADLDLYLWIYNDGDAGYYQAALSSSGGSVDEIIDYDLTEYNGKIYVEVRGWGDATSGFTLEFSTFTSHPPGAEDSSPLDYGRNEGELQPSEESVWFNRSIISMEEFRLVLTGMTIDLDLSLWIYDEYLGYYTAAQSLNSGTQDEEIVWDATGYDGPIFVQVKKFSGRASNFDLFMSVRNSLYMDPWVDEEPNNYWYSAVDLENDLGFFAGWGRIESPSDVDVYSIDVEPGDKVIITLSEAWTNLQLEVDDGVQTRTSNSPGSDNQWIIYDSIQYTTLYITIKAMDVSSSSYYYLEVTKGVPALYQWGINAGTVLSYRLGEKSYSDGEWELTDFQISVIGLINYEGYDWGFIELFIESEYASDFYFEFPSSLVWGPLEEGTYQGMECYFMSPTNTWDLGLLVIPLMAGQVNMSWLSTSAHYRFSSGTSLTTSYSGLSLTVEVTYDGEVGRLEYTYDANGRLVSFFFFLDGEIEHYVIDQSLCLAVNSPEDIEYAEGETGNIITWIPTGVDLIDPTYSIMRGTRVVKTGTWTSGRAISIDVDDLLEGDYSYQIILADGLGAEISDSVDVLVLEPEADSPFSVPGFSLPLLMAGSVIGLVWCARRRNNLHD